MKTFDNDLTPVLKLATNEELDPLVGYITGAFSESLQYDADYIEYSPDHQKYTDLIADEIKRFGGNTILNFFRGGGVSYYEVVVDVASRVGAPYSKEDSIEGIENSILVSIMKKSWEKMDDDEKYAFIDELGLSHSYKSIPKTFPIFAIQTIIANSGFLAYKLAAIIANQFAVFILGRGLSLASNIFLMRGMSIFAGPIVWTITGLWTVFELAGPAYRVTLPCVIHIAMLRKQYAMEYCPKCENPYTSEMVFCPKCGHKLKKADK